MATDYGAAALDPQPCRLDLCGDNEHCTSLPSEQRLRHSELFDQLRIGVRNNCPTLFIVVLVVAPHSRTSTSSCALQRRHIDSMLLFFYVIHLDQLLAVMFSQQESSTSSAVTLHVGVCFSFRGLPDLLLRHILFFSLVVLPRSSVAQIRASFFHGPFQTHTTVLNLLWSRDDAFMRTWPRILVDFSKWARPNFSNAEVFLSGYSPAQSRPSIKLSTTTSTLSWRSPRLFPHALLHRSLPRELGTTIAHSNHLDANIPSLLTM